jgi:hypothetical protein
MSAATREHQMDEADMLLATIRAEVRDTASQIEAAMASFAQRIDALRLDDARITHAELRRAVAAARIELDAMTWPVRDDLLDYAAGAGRHAR